jgi:hypothetical protein
MSNIKSEEFNILSREICDIDKRLNKIKSNLDVINKIQWAILAIILTVGVKAVLF